MTHEEKIEYMRISAGICCYGFSHQQMDLLVSLYELVLQKKGEGKLDEILHAQRECKTRADIKSKSELLDKVSDKIE